MNQLRSFLFSIPFFLFTYAGVTAQSPAPASGKVLAAAYTKAAKEKKKVLIIFKASWCSWCHKMDASINDTSCKKLFEDHYVVTHLTVDEDKTNKHLENKGADLVRKKYHGEPAGLPFWIIMDKNGQLLADSYIRKEGQDMNTPGESMGCPAEENEIAAFLAILKKTSSLTEEELNVIGERFRKNK